ncbi:MAG: hypothetical protein CMB97_00250 [Flavobacteriaceae bacterium]|nr:hypothetical protein [Flavobacteriaceae bacterium]
MKRFFSKHSLNIFTLALEKWHFPIHNHNFYELIFVEEGSGTHIVNDISVPYKKGDLFLLTPRDAHRFEIKEHTVFTFIKFTEQLLIEKTEGAAKGKWRKKIDAVLCNPNTSPESVSIDDEQKRTLFLLKDLLQVEYEKKDHFSRHIVLDLFGALITSISRSISEKKTFLPQEPSGNGNTVNQILAYVRQHIYDKEALTLEHLGDKFQYSPYYIGIFIKKHTGLSLRQIILETKVKTAERLLKGSELSIKEIAARLCFNDTSHFTKTFKKIKGLNPSDYR